MSDTETKQIFIVEDHAAARCDIIDMMNGESDLEVCGKAASADAAILQLGKLEPDLVISAITLDGLNELDFLREIKARRPSIKVLMISRHPETQYAQCVLKAGASGYVMEEDAPEIIVTAVREVLAGGIYVSTRMASKLLAALLGHPRSDSDPVKTLSDRELEVFEHIGSGQGNKEIAEMMNLSPRTVESYRARVKEKMGYPDGRTLVRAAIRWYDRHRGVQPAEPL